jgi:hypothetical protein
MHLSTAGPTARMPLLLARVSTALMVAWALAQAVLAGNFLGGQYDALAMHALGARAVTITSAVQIAILAWVWRRSGRRGPFIAGAVQTLLLVAEFATGELRLTALHVPLGVLLVVGIVQLAATVWRMPLPARRALDGVGVTP